MRLMRFGDRYGSKVPAIMDGDGVVRDASTLIRDIAPDTIGDGMIEVLRGADISALPVLDTKGRRVAPPTAQPRNILCIGLNYSDHAAEAGLRVPDEPILFAKGSATYCGPNDPIYYSPQMSKLDWEVELGVVIGKRALNITRQQALDHVLGLCVVNDVSERA